MAQSRATSTDPELPATSFSFENFATSSGTSHEVTSGPTRCVPTTSSLSTHSLSWRPRPVQKGSLEAGGLVHRPLQRRRDGTRRTTNPLKCLDVARGPVCRPHVHDQAPQCFKAIFASAKFAACGLVLRRRLPCTEEFVHLHGGKMPRHVTRLPVSGCASVGESLSTPWRKPNIWRRHQEFKQMLPPAGLAQGHFEVRPHESGGRRRPAARFCWARKSRATKRQPFIGEGRRP